MILDVSVNVLSCLSTVTSPHKSAWNIWDIKHKIKHKSPLCKMPLIQQFDILNSFMEHSSLLQD